MAIMAPAKQVGRQLLTWHPSAAEPAMAVRAAAGVATVVTVTSVFGPADWRAAAIYGTWSAGIPLLAAGVRPRFWLSLLAGGAVGVAILLGGFTASLPVLSIAVAAVWGLVMALIGAIGATAGVVTTVCGVAMVLSPHLSGGAGVWATAAAAACGGVVQAAMSLLPPWRRHRTECQALADAYRALAVDATVLADAMNTPMSTQALHDARRVVDRRRKLPDSMREAIGALYELRAAIVAVAAARARLLSRDATAARHTARVLRDTTIALDILAKAVERSESIGDDWEDRLAAAVESAPEPDSPRHSVAAQEISRLQRAVHRIARISERIVDDEPATTEVSRRVRARSRAAEDWQTLRANLTMRSPAMRHAVRASATIAIAAAVTQLWPSNHAYWIELTAWIALKPDFAATMGRGLARMLGTTAGVVLASVIGIALLGETPWLTISVVIAFALAGYLTMPVSFVIYSAAVAGFSVFQIELAGQSANQAAWDRGLFTLVGGALALTLYALWPTWQTRRLPEILSGLIDSYRDYAGIVLDMQARPADREPHRIQEAVDEVRLHRANLTAAAEQAAAEPIGGPRPYSTDALDVEAALSRAARALIVLEGNVRRNDAAHLAGIDEFREAVDACYARLAAWVRTGKPGPSAQLAQALSELDDVLQNGTEATKRRRRLLDWETDILVEALSDAELIIAEWEQQEPSGKATE